MSPGTMRGCARSKTSPATPVILRAFRMSSTAIQRRSKCMVEDSTLIGEILLKRWCIVSAEDSATASGILVVCCDSSFMPFNNNRLNCGKCCCKSRFYSFFLSFVSTTATRCASHSDIASTTGLSAFLSAALIIRRGGRGRYGEGEHQGRKKSKKKTIPLPSVHRSRLLVLEA